MPRLLEYINHHPYLAGSTLIVALAALAYELWRMSRGATGLTNNQTIALQNKGALLIDVRNNEEYDSGHIVDARHIELSQLATSLDGLKKYRDKPVVVYCESGQRSAQATRQLQAGGFTQVFNLAGGLAQWRRDNLPLERGAANHKGQSSKGGKKS